MQVRKIIFLLVGVLSLGLCSCGGSDSGGTITPSTVSVDSDVAKWTGTPCVTGSTYTVTPDVVNVTLNTFPPPPGSTGVTSEKVVIKSASIVYTPANTNSPSLPAQFMALTGQMADLGSSVTVPVTVAPQDLKSSPVLNSLGCTNTIYSYYVTITFNCDYYIANNNPFSVSSQINMRFADFAN